MSSRSIIVTLALCCLSVGRLRADSIRVPADFPEIQEAIDFAVDGDEVVVSDGVYVGPGN